MAVNCSDEVWAASCAAIVISTKNGDYLEARKAIGELGFPPDCEDQDGSTPLIAACSNNDPGSIEMIQYLLSVGANINAVNNTFDWTPLIAAAYSKNREAIEILLSHKVSPKVRHRDKYQKNAVDYIREQVLRSIPMATYIDAHNARFTYVSQYLKVTELRNRGQYITPQDEDKYRRQPPDEDEEPVPFVIGWTDTIVRLEQAIYTEKPSLQEQRMLREQKKAEEKEASKQVELERQQKSQELRQKHQEGMQKFKQRIRAHASFVRQTGNVANVPDPVIVVAPPPDQNSKGKDNIDNALNNPNMFNTTTLSNQSTVPHALTNQLAQPALPQTDHALPPIHPTTMGNATRETSHQDFMQRPKPSANTVNPLGIASTAMLSSFQNSQVVLPTSNNPPNVEVNHSAFNFSKPYTVSMNSTSTAQNVFSGIKSYLNQNTQIASASGNSSMNHVVYHNPVQQWQPQIVQNAPITSEYSNYLSPAMKKSNIPPLYRKHLLSKVPAPNLDLNVSRFLENLGHASDYHPQESSNSEFGNSYAHKLDNPEIQQSFPSYSYIGSQEPEKFLLSSVLLSPEKRRANSSHNRSNSVLNTPGFSPTMALRNRRGSLQKSENYSTIAPSFELRNPTKSLESEFSIVRSSSRLEPIGRQYPDLRRLGIKSSTPGVSSIQAHSFVQPPNLSMANAFDNTLHGSSQTFMKDAELSKSFSQKSRDCTNFDPRATHYPSRIKKETSMKREDCRYFTVCAVVAPVALFFLLIIVSCLNLASEDDIDV